MRLTFYNSGSWPFFPGLLVILCVASCIPDNPDDRYGGRVHPCDVVVNHGAITNQTFRPSGQDAAQTQRYDRLGPYYVWNTSPSPSCPQNPRTPKRLKTGPMPVYITYPSKTQPTQTGRAALGRSPDKTSSGKWPVVIFAHANNDLQCEIFDRYYTLHDHWASWGYVVVSVDSTLRNCLSGSNQNLRDRIDDQLWALTSLRRWHDDPTHWLHQRIDLSRVVFAGHSRGGGGSFIAAKNSGVERAIVLNLQGIDLTSFGFGEPSIDNPSMGITASRDVDLNYPHVEPNEALLKGPYSWVTLLGGIHAYSADTVPEEPDDDPGITQTQQHQLTNYYTTAFMAHHLGAANAQGEVVVQDTSPVIYGFEGVQTMRRHVVKSGAIVRWNRRINQTLVDDFNAIGPRPVNVLGLVNRTTGQLKAEATYAYCPLVMPSDLKLLKAKALYLRGQGQWLSALPADLVGQRGQIEARVKLPDGVDKVSFEVIVQSGSTQASFDGHKLIGPVGLTNRYTQLVLPVETIRAALPEGAIDAVGISLSDGSLILDDLRVSGPLN